MPDYVFTPTVITPNKRYPTYQFIGRVASRRESPERMLGLCVLETFKWLRERLVKLGDLPEELKMPEPEDLGSFDISQLSSFTLPMGGHIEVVWLPSRKLWAFSFTESDSGEKSGEKMTRMPVVGRTFITEASYEIKDGSVLTAFRTLCPEPVGTEQKPSSFRSVFVRRIAESSDLGLFQCREVKNEPLVLASKKDIERAVQFLSDPERQMPVIFITTPVEEIRQDLSPELPAASALMPTFSSVMNFAPADLISIQRQGFIPAGPVAGVKKSVKVESVTCKELETVDAAKLSSTLVTFAHVMTVPDKLFDSFLSELKFNARKGDIIIAEVGGGYEVIRKKDILGNTDAARYKLADEIKSRMINRSIDMRGAVFAAEARLLELSERSSALTDQTERNQLLTVQNSELEKLVCELNERISASASSDSENRQLRRELNDVREEIEELGEKLTDRDNEIERLTKKAESSVPELNFYKEKAAAAAKFPTRREDIDGWIEREFGGEIILHSSVKGSVVKYGRSLDLGVLCDGIYFLSGYVKNKRGEIKDSEFGFYKGAYNWEHALNSEQSINLFREKYTVEYKGTRRILDGHIKWGSSRDNWVRIYYFWDNDEKKIVIGEMPDHLPTKNDPT